MSDLDDPTSAATEASRGLVRGRANKTLALSIVWHPDLGRVGELVPLTDPSCEVSRLAPAFHRAANPEDKRPLGDKRLSRKAAFVLSQTDTHVELRAMEAAGDMEVDGELLESSRTFSWEVLDGGGVVISIGRHFALCLHLVRMPIVRGPTLGFVGESDRLEQVRRTIERLGDLDVPVLIRGETGTGKELAARAIVAASPRADRPFVPLNMAAIPPGTAAAHLFGHEKGAFTGATSDRGGSFVAADGGTLFMDEVGLMPPEVQATLLRVLDSGEVQPLGGKAGRSVNVRLLAATDAKLERAIAQGKFDAPLFHRLAGFQLELSPLRARRQDIGPLLLHFLRMEMAKTGELDRLDPRNNTARPWLSAATVAKLARLDLTGNARVLVNVARQLAISSRGHDQAQIDDVISRLLGEKPTRPVVVVAEPAGDGASATSGSGEPPVTRRRDQLPTEDEIEAALLAHDWQPVATATALGISKTTFYKLMEANPERFRTANSIPAADLLRAHDEFKGDLDRLSAHFKVSRRALQLRLGTLLDPKP